MLTKTGIVNVLSFDIEDWFHILDLPDDQEVCKWSEYESRVEKASHKLLDLLWEKKVKATFFVLGWIAERHPALVREIQNQGHEIGCHGYGHQLINALTKQKFRKDLLKARDIIDSMTEYTFWSKSLRDETTKNNECQEENGYRRDVEEHLQ